MINMSSLSGETLSTLIEIENEQQLDQQVAHAYFALKAAANQAGIDIEIISGYRSLQRQIAIWNRKWEGKSPLYNPQGQELEFQTLSEQQKLEAILTWSALPGTSRHHWGTDFDVYDPTDFKKGNLSLNLIPEEYEAGGPCFALSNWLQTNASRFGFCFPYSQYHGAVAAEPWHLSYQNKAQQYQNAITPEYLHTLISSTQLQGKEAITENLTFIYERFIQPYQTPLSHN